MFVLLRTMLEENRASYAIIDATDWEKHIQRYSPSPWEELCQGTQEELYRLYNLATGDTYG